MTIRSTIGCIVLASTLGPTVATNAQIDPPDQASVTITDQIDALVSPLAEAELISGAILVARGDEVLFDRTFGFANWELRFPNAPSTRFGIASITKPMTSMLVGVLASNGRLDVDATVETYIPGFPKGPAGGSPTIHQLLEHQAGVPYRVTEAIDETQPLLPADIVDRVKIAGLLFEPGTETLYSSAGYTCLARVIEIIEGRPFNDVMADLVFDPAGMAHATGETGPILMAGRALPYRFGAVDGKVAVKSAPYKDLRFLTGAGSVFATAEDLLHFVRAIRNGSLENDLWNTDRGTDANTWRGIYGRTNGYEASVDVLPGEDLTLVYLSNLQTVANGLIRTGIQNILQGREAATLPFPLSVAQSFDDHRALVGSYGRAEIQLIDGRLFRGENEFYPTSDGYYYIPASGTRMRFLRDAQGRVDTLVSINFGGGQRVMPRTHNRSEYLEGAIAAGRWLQSLSDREAGGAIPDEMGAESSPSPSLGTGAPGRIIFFLELFAATGDSTYLRSAEQEGRVTIEQTATEADAVGLYNGLGGAAFALAELAAASDDDQSFESAARDRFGRISSLAEWTGDQARWDPSNDVMTGAAGIGLSLLYAAGAYTDSTFADVAVAAGRALLATADTMPAGLRWHRWNNRALDLPNFSHGTAGVAYFLAVLAEYTGDEAFLDAAKAGAAYLIDVADQTDGLFLVPYGIPNDGYVTQYDIGWAHGPAGTARLFYKLWTITNDDRYGDIFDANARTILASGLPGPSSDTLRWSGPFKMDRRFGTSGAASFLLDAYMVARDEAYLDLATQTLDHIILAGVTTKEKLHWSLPTYGFQGGEGNAAFTGYLYGAAGLGLVLLQMHNAEAGEYPRMRFPDDPFPSTGMR